MPISKRHLIWATCASLTLAGCLEQPAVSLKPDTEFSYPRSAPRAEVLVPGAVTVAGPQGYCVDKRASRKELMIVVSCASATGNPQAPRPLFPMLLTASATPEHDGDTPILQQLPQLDRFFASPAGRAALSRDGQSESVRLIDTQVHAETFVIHSRHMSGGEVPGLGQDQWRALFNLNGQIVSASASTLRETPVSGDAGLANLLDFISQIRTVSQKSGEL